VDQKRSYLIDAGNGVEAMRALQPNQNIDAIFLTHAHYDHIAHIGDVIEKFPNCKIYCSEYTRIALADHKLNLSFYHGTPVTFTGEQINIVKENDIIPLFNQDKMVILETPGHNEGCLTFQLANYFFTGDALIPNIPIVTKLKSGNKQQAKESALKIKMATDENSIICPGHLNMIKSTEINWNIYINE
jgi:glyoxylase-like metal-dependent hydrolase (beta-lactamase superfamily II)